MADTYSRRPRGVAVSPYLLRPLRTFDEVQRQSAENSRSPSSTVATTAEDISSPQKREQHSAPQQESAVVRKHGAKS